MNLKSQIESLLFISAKAITVKQLADIIKITPKEAEKACDELSREYKESGRGVEIVKQGSQYQMVSSPDNAGLVKDFVKEEVAGELSRPSLEALTIISYRGPVAKIDLDRIRGINCGMILRNLLIRGLIEAREDKVKRETYYTVTLDFVRHLGLNEISELPDYERLNKEETLERMLSDN
ncbi:MAG: SMC-Scp complex subunit ScpB [Patescibacteria group bacterium]|jgi:segregation and condensation protein B